MSVTIPLDPKVRDRLQSFGAPGMSHDEILTRRMDEIERTRFVAEMRRVVEETPEDAWVDLDDIE